MYNGDGFFIIAVVANLTNTKQKNKKALVVFEGGNAPGYSAIAASLTEEAKKHGIELYAACEGFRSLTGDNLQDFRFVRLVSTPKEAYELNTKKIPANSTYKTFHDGGSRYRSERYPLFKNPEKIQAAAKFVKSLKITHLIGVGGNGTLSGIQQLSKQLNVLAGFVNISVDNDIFGDLSVGYLTGVEVGAQICHGLFNDAYTHKRIYCLEMMGRDSGRHALMSAAASRAHLVILPGFNLSDRILKDIAKRLNEESHALVVVAEGYARTHRPQDLNAAEFFKRQLVASGLREGVTRRVVAEGYSRYIRGVEPLFIETAMAALKIHALFNAFESGMTEIMPYYLGEFDLGVRKFSEIQSSNQIDLNYIDLIDRLNIKSLRSYVTKEFKEICDRQNLCPISLDK